MKVPAALYAFCAAATLALLASSTARSADVTVTIDPTKDRRAISPLIYGVNFGTAAQMNRVRFPVRRWGGNSTTRYSWQDDISNRASDWFYYNIEEPNPNPATLPHGSTTDRFIDEARAAFSEPLITVPTIGWTPRDRVRRWGFSVSKYGAQQNTECTVTGFPTWCQPDAGNGIRTNGTAITGNDPTDTSRVIGPDFVTAWMAHIASRVGTAGQGGVKYFALDNEPMLWNSTHRDVFPNPLTYDGLWQRTQSYAAAVKAQDPNVRVMGFSPWGYCDYFTSAADVIPSNCIDGPDRQAHGGLPLVEWYLLKSRQYEDAQGVRLIDLLDIHYYPQANGVALSTDESAATSAGRLRSLKSLYDPAYTDESWIPGSVFLIPRMKQWIAARAPGTQLAITEYNWGDGGISSALAQAEALAIFGREGVDLATRWVAPEENSLIEDAFRLYLDYDGAGSRVAGETVRTQSTNVDMVGAYTVRGASGRLFVLLFNKDTAAHSVSVALANPPAGLSQPAQLFRFDAANRLGSAGSATPVSGALSLSLPARSATLAVTGFDVPPPPATRFFTLQPCRILDTRDPDGPFGGPALAAGSDRAFAVAGRCAIPPTAKAISANVVALGSAQAVNLTTYAADLPAPNVTTVQTGAGKTRASATIIGLAADGTGRFAARSTAPAGKVHVIVDVNGYFE